MDEVRERTILVGAAMKDERALMLEDFRSGLTVIPILVMSVWTDPETKALAETLGAVQLLEPRP
jgi:hypothetical protein